MTEILSLETGHLHLSAAFVDELARGGCRTTRCDSLAGVGRLCDELKSVDAVIAHQLDLPLVRQLIKAYPTLDYALVSPLSPEEFHELTEGYGIFMQLPPQPTARHGREMLRKLDHLRQPRSGGEGASS